MKLKSLIPNHGGNPTQDLPFVNSLESATIPVGRPMLFLDISVWMCFN